MKKLLFSSPPLSARSDWGLLVLRVSFGLGMAIGHGLPKLLDFAEKSAGFSDPLGIGSTASLTFAVLAELLFAIFVYLGVFTRISTVPVIFTMGVAAFVVHGAHPIFDSEGPSKEFALIYLLGYVAILIMGPGRFSVDHKVK